MRIQRTQRAMSVIPAHPIKFYYTIFKRGGHDYGGMPECEFCWVCNHSLLYHIENKIRLRKERRARERR